jgi:hypothetical protein
MFVVVFGPIEWEGSMRAMILRGPAKGAVMGFVVVARSFVRGGRMVSMSFFWQTWRWSWQRRKLLDIHRLIVVAFVGTVRLRVVPSAARVVGLGTREVSGDELGDGGSFVDGGVPQAFHARAGFKILLEDGQDPVLRLPQPLVEVTHFNLQPLELHILDLQQKLGRGRGRVGHDGNDFQSGSLGTKPIITEGGR